MFDVDKILGNKKSKKKFADQKMSDIFGKNIVSDAVGKITDKPLKNMGASVKKQNEWKGFSHQKRNQLRRKHKDSDGDRIPNPWDCSPFNTMKQDVRFARKPNKIDKTMWEKQKNVINNFTKKDNSNVDPIQKMNTIMEHDKEIKKLKKINPVFHDESWHSNFNAEAKNALKKQGYNDDDVTEYLSKRNKTRSDTAAYFAQELAKDKKLGHLFKGAIPDVPISEEEGRERYNKFQNESKYISGIGQVEKNEDSEKEKHRQEMIDFWEFDPYDKYEEPELKENNKKQNIQGNDDFEMSEQTKEILRLEKENELLSQKDNHQNFLEEQDAEEKEYKRLKQKPRNQLTYNEKEFLDAMNTSDMDMSEMEDYYNSDLSYNPIDDRWKKREDIFEKEQDDRNLTQNEKDYARYHDLIEEDFTKLSKQDQDFLKEYRFKKGFDTDVFDGENDEVDSEAEFYKWRDNKK